ncbi:hypothetical protein dsx2_1772 [Desulfovibrio sp. X2]|uniref:hypothetical protein n=1 Tax=Desulfovibrio sp. X2 TaxID=941449 RepID=UPI0003589775|nr:hypothetical protein [Desulfovibrio sp. X2]EPR44411.1 hypothetical protein dsx2_1772 [Desulfovibrio sp. X2]
MSVSSLTLSYGQNAASVFGSFAGSLAPRSGAVPVQAVPTIASNLQGSTSGKDFASTAQMIVDKLSQGATVGENGGRNGDGLAASLTRTAQWMSSSYGDQAGQSFLGVIAGYVGNGSVGEDALSKGMLAAIRLTDQNYGVSAGDALANELNGDLNPQVNAYFDNGLNEKIYTATVPAGSLSGQIGQALASAVSGIADRFGADEGQSAQEMLLDSLKNASGAGGLVAGLRKGLSELASYYDEKYGTDGTGGTGAAQTASKTDGLTAALETAQETAQTAAEPSARTTAARTAAQTSQQAAATGGLDAFLGSIAASLSPAVQARKGSLLDVSA